MATQCASIGTTEHNCDMDTQATPKEDTLANSPQVESLTSRVKVWFKRAGIVLCGAAGSYLFLTALAAYPLSNLLVKPQKKRLAQLSSRHLRYFFKTHHIRYQEMAFQSFDGIRLHGWFLKAGRWKPTVIALHGVTGNRTSMIRFAVPLYEAGFNVFVFDGRAHGLSQGEFVTYGYHETHDVSAIIDYLIRAHKIREKSIGLIGMSMGAAIALLVAAREKRVQAVWSESPFSSLERISNEYISDTTWLPESVVKPFTWSAAFVANRRGKFNVTEVSPVDAAPQINCPVQLVHGAKDMFVRPEHSQRIYEMLTAKHKDLWIVDGAAHTQCFHFAREEYPRRLITFFRTHLGW